MDARETEHGSTPTTAAAQSASVLQLSSPLALQVATATGPVVGRPVELASIDKTLTTAASGRLSAVTVEGEPGIGKTRLLLAAADAALDRGMTTISVAADEELRGPFLLARSIVGSPAALAAAEGTVVEQTLARCLDALTGNDDPSLGSLSPDRRVLRTLDLAAVALRDLAAQRPLAILVDDLQWADDDSLRLLRYVVRSVAASPIFVMAAMRPEEFSFVTEAVNLIADMERLGMVRRLRLGRFTQVETSALLANVLGHRIDPSGGATIHAQAEGVPFIVEELARAYRDAGMIHEIAGVWTLAKNAERLVPSAVRTLISRRAARLPDTTKAWLALAAVLGRHFSLKDLREVGVRVDQDGARASDAVDLDDRLSPAVTAGLLMQHADGSPADYSFVHDQVRDFAAASLTPARRRAVHAAIVELLMAGEPAPESLPLVVHHARAAGDAFVCTHFSLQASRNALDANAPEEVLRVVELALPVASSPQERIGLLSARDEALEMLRRPEERLEGLAELAALADALSDPHLELDVMLRRAAALRSSGEPDGAAAVARRVRDLASARGDRPAELAACLELGQALLRTPIGETFVPPAREVDLDGAQEAYRRAAELSRELSDEGKLAASLRELGVIDIGRIRAWFVEQILQGARHEFLRQATSAPLDEILARTPVAPLFDEAAGLFKDALEIYERLGDRRGAMATIIALGYLTWGPDIHLGSHAARHIEEIRRLSSHMTAFTKESERGLAEAQMLYGAHVFARAKLIPDLAVSRGEAAHRQARLIGDRQLEFSAAGGTALAQIDLGDSDAAEAWLERAAAAAAHSPTPLRARQLETWRGLLRAARGDADGMRAHLQRAVEMATEQAQPAARCETLARLALEAARLGAERSDAQLLGLAEASANEAKEISASLPGHPPWGAQADAARADVALARGDTDGAVAAARSALADLESAMHEDHALEVVLPAARALLAGGTDGEREGIRDRLRVVVAMIAQRTFDEEVRARFFRGPLGRELARVAGPVETSTRRDADSRTSLDPTDAALVHHLIEGRSNREIAEQLGIGQDEVIGKLGELFVRMGASSRAEATAFAFREGIV